MKKLSRLVNSYLKNSYLLRVKCPLNFGECPEDDTNFDDLFEDVVLIGQGYCEFDRSSERECSPNCKHSIDEGLAPCFKILVHGPETASVNYNAEFCHSLRAKLVTLGSPRLYSRRASNRGGYFAPKKGVEQIVVDREAQKAHVNEKKNALMKRAAERKDNLAKQVRDHKLDKMLREKLNKMKLTEE